MCKWTYRSGLHASRREVPQSLRPTELFFNLDGEPDNARTTNKPTATYVRRIFEYCVCFTITPLRLSIEIES